MDTVVLHEEWMLIKATMTRIATFRGGPWQKGFASDYLDILPEARLLVAELIKNYELTVYRFPQGPRQLVVAKDLMDNGHYIVYPKNVDILNNKEILQAAREASARHSIGEVAHDLVRVLFAMTMVVGTGALAFLLLVEVLIGPLPVSGFATALLMTGTILTSVGVSLVYLFLVTWRRWKVHLFVDRKFGKKTPPPNLRVVSN